MSISDLSIRRPVATWMLYVAIAVVGDVMFIVSLFVLGGDFWDKLRGLFSQKARMHFAEETP